MALMPFASPKNGKDATPQVFSVPLSRSGLTTFQSGPPTLPLSVVVGTVVIAADCESVQLRSERDETVNGRVYVITLRVKDASGNTTRKDFKVSVPINQNGTAAVQGATAQTKTSVCP